MKFWFKSLEKLKESAKTLRSVYESMCTFGRCVFFEWLEGNTVRTSTYGEFAACTAKTAAAFKEHLGLPGGSYVGLEMENCPEWVISFWALLMAGFRPVLLNTRMSAGQLDGVIAASGIAAVVTKNPVRAIDIAFDNLRPSSPEAFRPDWEDIFALTTSGTTSEPRIFAYNGAAICGQIFASEYVLTQNGSITYNGKGEVKLLAFLPFYHIFGLITNLMWFGFFGRSFVFLKDYRPETIRYACRRHGVTHFFGVPAVWNGLASYVRREASGTGRGEQLERALKFSIGLQSVFLRLGRFTARVMFRDVREKIFGDSVMFCISGGGYLRDDTLRVLNGLGYPLYNGYGMTEIGIASVELSGRAAQRVKGSVGKPFPGTEYVIDGGGTLGVRGGTMHFAEIKDGKLYPRDPAEFFLTGDFFEKDAKGNCYVRGRQDEIIIADNGEKIPPDSIEKRFDLTFAEHFCVFGVREDGQTRIILLICPKKNITSVQLDAMLTSVYEAVQKLPAGEKISKVMLTADELPVTSGAKVQRTVIRDGYLNKTLKAVGVDLSRYADTTAVKDENYQKTLTAVIEIFGRALNLPAESITEKGNFMLDFDGGSLEYFSLLAELSKTFNVHFDFTENFLATPAEFARYIGNKSG